MAWFKRTKKGIQTTTKDKKDTPEGLWHKTPSGKIVDNDELIKNNYVSPEDALRIANHIQDRLEREGKWAKKECKDKERVLVIK